MWYSFQSYTCTGCSYEVPRTILLQASYLYAYSWLSGVTFQVIPFSSYARIPKILPLLEIFFELLLWKNLQRSRHVNLNIFSILKY